MTKLINITLILPADLAGLRMDQALARALPDYSRTEIRNWIEQGAIHIAGQPIRASARVRGDEAIEIKAHKKIQPTHTAQAIPLDIVFEDESVLVINKPAGLVVHPAPGNPDNTLLNALLHHAPALAHLPRAGIIHRLDRDTSGLLVIAKTDQALKSLSAQMRARTIHRVYQAIANGVMISGGSVDAPVGRHPINRKRMAVLDNGKKAITHYRVTEKFRAHTRLRIQLETGRTHQIRVHMAHIRHPLLGDPVYGGRLSLPKGATPELIEILRHFKRQALHAAELGIKHPVTGEIMQWQSALPADMQRLSEILRRDGRDGSDAMTPR